MKAERQGLTARSVRIAAALVVAVVSIQLVARAPHAAAAPPPGSKAYVTNYTTPGTVSVVDLDSGQLTKTIPVGPYPQGVTLSPDGRLAYVANSGSPCFCVQQGSISVIDVATDTVTATISGFGTISDVTLSPDGSHAYTSDTYDNKVFVIDTSTNAVVQTFTVPAGPSPNLGMVSVTPDGAHLYVPSLNTDTVFALDAATGALIASIPVGSNPQIFVFSPDGSKLYMTDVCCANPNPGTISVIDTATNTATSMTSGVSEPGGLAISPAGDRLYVGSINSGAVAVIDTATGTVVSTAQVSPPLSYGVALSGGSLYVVDPTNGLVREVDPSTLSVVRQLPAGQVPFWVAIAGPTVDRRTTLTATPTSFARPKFSATLAHMATGVPIAGETVTFTIDGAVICSATTDASGVATCQVNHAYPKSSSYTASFAGSATLDASQGTAALTSPSANHKG